MAPPPLSPPTSLSWSEQPLRELLRLSWPTAISLISLSIMTLADTLFIGWIGSSELAAAGLGGVCAFTALSFGMAVLAAAKVKVGESHGRGDIDAVNQGLGAFLRLAGALGAFSILLAWLTARALPHLTPLLETGTMAADYLSIRSWGFLPVMVSTAIVHWLQAQGDSKTAMRAALLANVANIPLNALLVFGCGLGVYGAATATAVSRVAEMAYLVVRQSQHAFPLSAGRRTVPGFHLSKASWGHAGEALMTGLSTGVERVLDMIAFAAIPLLLAQLGSYHVAAHQIVLQITLFSFLPLIALSESVSVLTAQAVGAGALTLVPKLNRLGLIAALGYAVICGVACIALAGPLVAIFSSELDLRQLAQRTLLYGALLQLLNAAYNHFKGVLRGLSVFRFVAWVTVGCAWIVTPPLTYVWGVVAGHGAPGAWLVLCVEVSIGATILIWRTHKELAARLLKAGQ